MGKQRVHTTDYNDSPKRGRVARIGAWWFAPQNVTAKSKKISATFMILVVAVLAAFGVMSLLRSDPVAPQGQQVSAPVPASKAVCPEQDAVEFSPEQVILTVPETTWVRDGDMMRPTSQTSGPGKDSPYPSCFARTPEGALYAAASFATGVLSALPAGDEKDFFEARASHTGNYSVLIADLPDAGPAQNRPTVRFSGYRWNGYTPDLASVELRYTLVTGPRAGSNTAITYTMTWENNDWLLVVPGKTDTVAAPVDSTRTYIPWGGTS